MSHVQESYTAKVVAANGSVKVGQRIGGFLCTTSGTISLTANRYDGTTETLFTGLAVTAGSYMPLPFFVSDSGGTFTCAGGAAGVLGVV